MFINRPRGKPQPANRGAVVSARSGIDRLARAAQERTINGLAVEGYPCQYFAYKKLGTICTCNAGGLPNPTAPQLPTTPGTVVSLDPDGNASPQHIAAMLQGSRISINRYGSRAPLLDEDEREPGMEVPFRGPIRQSLLQHNKTTDGTDEFAEVLEPDDDLDALLGLPNGANAGSTMLQAAGQSGCGVCLGSGYVGGYNLLNGSRLVYDTQHPWAVNGYYLDRTATPTVYKQASPRASAQLFVLLPRGATKVRAVRLWNNKTLLAGYRAELQVAAAWVPLTARALLSQCDGQLHAIRITSLEQDLSFTHLEVALDLHLQPVYVEWGRLTQTENPRLPENTESLQVVISPTVPNVSIYDILIDSVYNRVWKITSVTNFKDRRLRTHGWEVQIRLVQQFEFPQLLSNSVLLHRHAEGTNALVPGLRDDDWMTQQDLPTP